MQGNLRFAREQDGALSIVRLSGRLDASVAADVRSELKPTFESDRPLILFDLEHIEFIDSSGLSVLVTALKAASPKGGDVGLLRVTPAVRTILELTRLYQVFRLFDDESKARAHLNALAASPRSDVAVP